MRKYLSLVGGLMALMLTMSTFAYAAIDIPEYDSGDKWTMAVDVNEPGMDFTGDWTFKVKGTETVSGYSVYHITLEGEGTVSMELPGLGTATMDYTMDGFEYARTSDLRTVRNNVSFHMSTSILGIVVSIDMFTDMSYDPPVDELGFPLEVGDEWTSESSVTTTSVYAMTYGTNTTSEKHTDTETQTMSFKCESMETIAVPAGTFETYKIKQTEDDGDYTYNYVSEKVGYIAKSEGYDDEDNLQISMELKSYSYGAGAEGDLAIMDYLWLIILIVVIIIVIVAVAAVRSRRVKEPPAGQIPPPQ